MGTNEEKNNKITKRNASDKATKADSDDRKSTVEMMFDEIRQKDENERKIYDMALRAMSDQGKRHNMIVLILVVLLFGGIMARMGIASKIGIGSIFGIEVSPPQSTIGNGNEGK